MKKFKMAISLLLVLTLISINFNQSLVFAKGNNKKNMQIFYSGDTKIVATEEKDKTTVDVYINGVIAHSSIVEKSKGLITEKKNGNISHKKISDFISNVEGNKPLNDNYKDNINSLLEVNEQVVIDPGDGGGDTAPSGYSLLSSWYGHIGSPYLVGYLWGKNYTTSGTARRLTFSAGTLVGTIVGIVLAVIPGADALEIIYALGSIIVTDVIASSIDGKIYAVDKYTDFKVTVKNIVSLITHRFTRYAKVINCNTGEVELQYVGSYGNWSDYQTLIYQGISNYLTNN